MALARLHVRIPVIDAEGDKVTGATVKLYNPGTAAVSGVTTTGTPYAGNLYAAVTGGSPVSTTQTTDANGEVVIYSDTKSRFDVGIEIGGASPIARVASYETFELDPADVMTSASGTQSVIQTGTLAAPSLAQTGNLDTGFNVDSDGDPGISREATGVFETTSTTTTLRSPNGTFVASIGNTTGFVAPDLPRWFNATNNVYGSGYQLVEESNATGVQAAANATALAALWTAVATAGGGTIYIPRNSSGKHYAINTTVLNHDLGFGVAVNLVGDGYATALRFYGTSGNLLDIGTNANSLVNRGTIRDLTIYGGSEMTSGSMIRLGLVQQYLFENIQMPFTGTTTNPFTCVTVGNGALIWTNLTFRDCIFNSTDKANAGPMRVVGSTLGIGGLNLEACELAGQSSTNCLGLYFANTAQCDTVKLVDTGIGGCNRGIWVGAVGVSNVLMTNVIFANAGAQNILLDATGSSGVGGCSNWLIANSWFAGSTSTTHLDLTEGAAGTLQTFVANGNYFTDGTGSTLVARTGIVGLAFNNNIVRCPMGAAGAVLDFQGVTDLTVVGNIIDAGGSATSSISVDAATDAFVIGPNVLRGKDVAYAGALSNSRVILDRAFKA